jgi:DNA invertase Pin-like site-specific DNA recombinase
MPDSQPRAVAYVRESTEEQGQGFSPDAQRQAIARFAAENGMAVTDEYCDFHSGWRKADGRPEFQRLMTDAADRKFDVVLVFHTSRFARNQVEARRYKQLLRERLGIKVFSVTQPMGEDPRDPSSFLAESIHEMFDEYYSVSLSFWTRSGLREKARQGYLVGTIPWGYRRDGETDEVVPHPDQAPLVAEMFKRYATGQESDRSIAEWLNARGARTTRGRAFSKDTVREMLCNTAFCGYVSGLRDKSRAIKGPTNRSSAKSCSTASRTSARGARGSSSPDLHPTSICCASCSTASTAAPACTAPVAHDQPCAATSARRAAPETPAARRSSRPSRSKRS